MRRWLPFAGLVLLLAGCDTGQGLADAAAQSIRPSVPTDPARDVFGVSAPAGSSDAATSQQLDWKVGQLCTNGADEQQQAMMPAEDGQQFAGRTVICKPYRVTVFQ